MSWQFREIPREDSIGWNAALAHVPHSWWHSWDAASALSSRDEDHLHLIWASSQDRHAVCIARERAWKSHKDLCTPWGFTGFSCSGPSPGLAQAWAQFAASSGYVCGYFALHPALRCAGHFGLEAAHELYLVDLHEGTQAVLARSHHSVARALREWRRQGREFVTDRERIHEFLAGHYRDFMVAKGARPGTVWNEAALRELCRTESVLMVGSEDAQGLCAVHVIGWTRDAGDSLAMVSVRDGRRDTVSLTWWAIEQLAARGVPVFNLGGGVRAGDSLARFKREKFAPRCVPMWSAREIYGHDAYQRLLEELAPGQRASTFFPPWHAAAAPMNTDHSAEGAR